MRSLVRKEIYDVDTVFDALKEVNFFGTFILDGDEMKAESLRYKTFFKDSCTCATCGTKGVFFAKERSRGSKRGSYHLNLYSIVNGKEMLMTKDHFIAKSKGGSDDLNNLNTMCEECNSKKGNKVPIYLIKDRTLIYI